MRETLVLLALVASLLVTAGCETIRRVQVSRHESVAISDADADRILADMSSVARGNDGPGDVPAKVRFQREGPVGVFDVGTGDINSEADFDAVLGLPGQVKIVNEINWCGGLAPNIIGCAPVPGDSLVVVRFAADQEGILWLHEHGHNKGLSHRNAQAAVMNPMIGPNHKRLNQAEASAINN
jgi:hypothetical protein